MGFLTYLGLNLVVSLMRLSLWLRGSPRASPTSVEYIPSRDKGRAIKAHIYKPKSLAPNTPSPVLLNFHGSGMVLPLHGSDDAFCRRVTDETSYTVVDVQYRLSPEHPFPAALNDVEDAVKWALARCPHDFDPARVSVSGFSAGANLVMAAAGVLFPAGTFRSLVAFYPAIDLFTAPGDKVPPDTSGRPIPAAVARVFNACYIGAGTDAKDPRVSPAFAQPDRFPANVLVMTGACDSLALEAERLAAKIEAAADPSRRVVVKRYDKCNHGWDKGFGGATGSAAEVQATHDSYALAIETLSR